MVHSPRAGWESHRTGAVRPERAAVRVLFITQYFQPEPTLLMGVRFIKELQKLGFEVQVLTGFPNYPGGRLYPGYRTKLWQRETLDGVEVIRVPVYPSHDRSAIRRALCYGSLALTMTLFGPFLVRKPEAAVVFLGPMTLCLPALLFKCLWGTPFLMDIQDLWPESVTGSGMLRGKWIHRVLSWCCTFAYRRAKHIVVLSEGYKSRLLERGAREDQVSVVYNWCDPDHEQAALVEGVNDSFHLQGTFNVVYAGNLGELQALDHVIRAAKLLQDTHPSVRIILVGGGTQEAQLKDLTTELALQNVTFIPRLPSNRLPEVLHFASVLLVHLKRDPLSEVGIPQKTQAYLASGIPVLCAVDGEASRLVERSGGGIACRAESPEALAEAIASLARLPERELKQMGRRGRDFYTQHLSFAIGTRRMAALFESMVSAPGPSAGVVSPKSGSTE